MRGTATKHYEHNWDVNAGLVYTGCNPVELIFELFGRVPECVWLTQKGESVCLRFETYIRMERHIDRSRSIWGSNE